MSDELKIRFKKAAIALMKDLRAITYTDDEYDIKKQLIRSAMSTAANYRAACRSKSSADFLYKLKIVEEECDESLFWLEVLKELNSSPKNLSAHHDEFTQLLSITVSSIKTLRKRNSRA